MDLSCPIELRGYELLGDDLGYLRAYIKLMNLSNQPIVSYGATVSWYNGLTQERITENIVVDACEIAPKHSFRLSYSTKNTINADHLEMYFTGIQFLDGSKWQPEDGALVDIGEQRVLTGAKLDALRKAAGYDAIQYPQVQKDFWRCVCGRINLLETDECIRCGRDRQQVLTKFNAKAFSPVHTNPKKAPVRRKKTAHRRLRYIKGILIALAVIAVIAAVTFGIAKIGPFNDTRLPGETQPIIIDDMPVSI